MEGKGGRGEEGRIDKREGEVRDGIERLGRLPMHLIANNRVEVNVHMGGSCKLQMNPGRQLGSCQLSVSFWAMLADGEGRMLRRGGSG